MSGGAGDGYQSAAANSENAFRAVGGGSFVSAHVNHRSDALDRLRGRHQEFRSHRGRWSIYPDGTRDIESGHLQQRLELLGAVRGTS